MIFSFHFSGKRDPIEKTYTGMIGRIAGGFINAVQSVALKQFAQSVRDETPVIGKSFTIMQALQKWDGDYDDVFTQFT